MAFIRSLQTGDGKAKFDPLAFIRKTAQTVAFASLGVAEPKRDRTKIYVGHAIDTDQRRPLTLEESLQFVPPKRRPKVYAGSIADIKLPASLEKDGAGSHRGSIHHEAVDYFIAEYGQDDFDGPPRLRDIALDVLKPLDSEIQDDLELESWDDPDLWVQKVDWNRVAQKVGLDKGERLVLQSKLAGQGRDFLMAQQRTPEKRRYGQAAWKRFQRKWPEIVEAVKRSPSSSPVTPTPAACTPGRYLSSRSIAASQRTPRSEKKSGRVIPDSLP